MMRSSQNGAMTMGFGWCMLAVLFLFNPNVNIIDFFPDFFGYIFLCVGLAKLAELNEEIAQARKGFFKMLAVDLCKIPAMVWVFGLSVPAERNSSLLLWAFVFAALEMVFAIPAYVKLFEGMTQIGYFYPNSSLFGDRSEGRSKTDQMKRLTVFFVAWKAILSVLPEFADLTNSSYDETSVTVNLYRYVGIMRFLTFIPALIVGVLWLLRMLRYFSAIRRDEALCKGLLQTYRTDILPRAGLFVRRRFATIPVLVGVAWILMADLRLEGINVLPDLLAAVVFFGIFWMLRKDTPVHRWLLPGIVMYAVTAAAELAAEFAFHTRYSYHAAIRSEEAMLAYGILMAATILKNLAFVGMLATFITSLKQTVTLHTGYVAGREIRSEREENMVAALHRERKRSLTLCWIISVLYGVMDVLYWVFVPNYGFMGLIHTLLTVLCTGVFVKSLSAIREAVDTKYMLA